MYACMYLLCIMYVWIHVCVYVYMYVCSAVGWGTALQVGKSWVRFPMVWLEFFIDINYGSGVDSVSDRNKYQKYFLGLKAAGA
jgi:hypothetical protein